MGRPRRIDYAGAWHHVMNRGARRQASFLVDADRESFLSLLGLIQARYKVAVHAYCLMGNHFHIVAQSEGAGLSAAMQYLTAVYTLRFNQRHGLDGPLFRGRFHSKLIDTDQYLLAAIRYVHRNPLELGPATGLDSYPWSSHAAYLRPEEGPQWLHRSFVLGLLGHDLENYRRVVEPSSLHPCRTDAVPDWTPPEECDDPPESAAIGAVEQAIVEVTGVPLAQIHRAQRGQANVPRALALALAASQRIELDDTLARRFGYSSTGGVRAAIHRARRLVARDQTAALLYERANRIISS